MCTFSKSLYYQLTLKVPILKYRSIYHPKFSFNMYYWLTLKVPILKYRSTTLNFHSISIPNVAVNPYTTAGCPVLLTECCNLVFTPQSLRAVGVLFPLMVSIWAGGPWDKVCPGFISETIRCRKLVLGRDIS